MRQTSPSRWILCSGMAVIALLCLARASVGMPQQNGNDQSTRMEPAKLPISYVVLFSSGVGYFQREGTIDGNAKVDLAFPTASINDLLKSMVLEDKGGGKVGVISYDSSDPIEKTLKSFAIDLTNNPTLATILGQARGEEVELLATATGPQPGEIKGRIVSVEKQKVPAGKDGQTVEEDVINLWTVDGLRSIPLKTVQKLRFANPVIDNELKRALEALAKGHDKQKKNVSILFNGQGQRAVRVGYVIESPIWKTSYRLVTKPDGKALLQGWAMVENPSDEDWTGVRMALISGRPVSFKMDLYQPLYVPRPTVEPELFASLRPQTYGGKFDAVAGIQLQKPALPSGYAGIGPAGGGGGLGGGGLGGGGIGGAAPGTPNFMNPSHAPARKGFPLVNGSNISGEAKETPLEIGQSIASAATAEELGDYFQYSIDEKVNLQRQKSAMLPIVNKDVEGTKVSIYNESVHAKHPLLGLRFKNTSGMQLMQGPITVFEGSNYAGDARILDLQPNEERLLSYAIDLGTEVKVEGDEKPEHITTIKAVKGLIEVTRKYEQTKKFMIKNRNDQAKTLLLEMPIREGWKLKKPAEPSERSRDVYRFQVKLEAGGSTQYQVEEEMLDTTHAQLYAVDTPTMISYSQQGEADAETKAFLKKAIELRQKLADVQKQLAETTREMEANSKDQDRLRKNLERLPQNSVIYQDTLKKFEARYKELDKLEQDEKRLRAAQQSAQQEMDKFLGKPEEGQPQPGAPAPGEGL